MAVATASRSGDVTALAEPLRTDVERLIRDTGGRVYLVSGLRSPDEQIALRKAHCGTSAYAIYQMPASSCHPATAKPGSSKHERGEAADLGGDLDYAHAHAAEYHIHFPVTGENWHAESTKATIPGALGLTGGALPLGLPTSPIGAAGTLVDAVGFLTNPENWQRLLWLALGALAAGWGTVLLVGSVTL